MEHEALKELIAEKMGFWMWTEYLVVAECCEQQYWDASVCKNTAHCLARERLEGRSWARGAATVSGPPGAGTVSGSQPHEAVSDRRQSR